jgi:hypothetical protein
MEKVFYVFGENAPKVSWMGKEYSKEFLVNSEAIVEKVLGHKLYLVSLQDGTKLTAKGSASISKGMKVQVSSLPVFEQKDSGDGLNFARKNGDRLSVLFPFKMGNKTPEAKIELYVEREKEGVLSKRDTIVYLVFAVKTSTYGQIQWSVYLKGTQILVQVYAENNGSGEKNINQMIRDFEGSLKKKGFSLLAPTVILKKPFKVPFGFRLNIQG